MTIRDEEALREAFALHPLALEDVLHRGQRAKAEAYEAHQFVVLNLVQRDRDDGGRGSRHGDESSRRA